MDFTILFLENLTGIATPSSLTSLGSMGLSSTGSALMEADNDSLNTLGVTSTSLGTSLSLNGEDAYEKTKQQLELTQAYVESLNQEELEELIARLEVKEAELSLNEDSYIRTLTKHPIINE